MKVESISIQNFKLFDKQGTVHPAILILILFPCRYERSYPMKI